MSEITDTKKISMANAVKRLRESNQRTFTMLKADRFLSDADWKLAESVCDINNPYMDDLGEEDEDSETPVLLRHSTCPGCQAYVPNTPSPKEYAEMREEGRVRLIKGEKVSYWKQFEHGMLCREALQTLNNAADSTMDKEGKYVDLNDIENNWKTPPYLQKIKDRLASLRQVKAEERVPAPTNRFLHFFYVVTCHVAFDAVMNFFIISNMIPIIMEVTTDETVWYLWILQITNYVYSSLYFFEAIGKILGFRKYYFKDYWNLLDLFILILSIVDIVLELAQTQSANFSPSIFKVARVFRFLRMGRLLKLVRIILPTFVNIVNNMINKKLRLGYDIGKGFIVGEEEVIKLVDHMVVDKKTSRELKAISEKNRLDVLKSLGLLQRDHPGIAISVKTRQAIRSVLNHARSTIEHLRGGGVLDDSEGSKLQMMIEVKMKRQLNAPPYIPPRSPESLLSRVIWLDGLQEEIISYIMARAEMKVYEYNETLVRQGDVVDGIYLIISGLVKIMAVSIAAAAVELGGEEMKEESFEGMRVTTDYLCAGNTIGEMGLLTGTTRNASAVCETGVQAYFISAITAHRAMDVFPSLRERMWRICGIRIAVPLLMNMPSYHGITRDNIRFKCEKCDIAFFPRGSGKIFRVRSDHMAECILIQGAGICLDSRENYEAPLVLPKSVRTLKLTSEKLDTRILVIFPESLVNHRMDSEGHIDDDTMEDGASKTMLKTAFDVMMSGQPENKYASNSRTNVIIHDHNQRPRKLSLLPPKDNKVAPMPNQRDENEVLVSRTPRAELS